MPKLHYCEDGTLVVDQVLNYQSTGSTESYMSVHEYYAHFKDKWYSDLKEYLDRSSFDSDFDFKLCKAVKSFDEKQARFLCEKYRWGFTGAFNRWFFAVLRNWKSNVKTAAYRQKKRPSVKCPICNRSVVKIDERHLAHYKTTRDLPKGFRWKGQIYSVVTEPNVFADCWGSYTLTKLKDINEGSAKNYMTERTKVRWPWFTKEGRRGVMCPFTKNIVLTIDNEYIRFLPDEHNRYARSLTWHDFIEEFPSPVLIQAEIYSLDYNHTDDDMVLKNSIAIAPESNLMTPEDFKQNKITSEYEHAFYLIESLIKDEVDQKVLKLTAAGYTDDDISSVLEIDKKEVRHRKRNIRETSEELREKLVESV